MKLHENGVYLLNGTEIIEDNQEAAACLAGKNRKNSDRCRSCNRYNGISYFEST